MYLKYFKYTLFWFLLALFFVGIVNYTVDPLWIFSHKNVFNRWQQPFNERQQKVNYITFNKYETDILIMGTSRTIYISHNNFYPLKAFNFSLSGAAQAEYYDYVNYFKSKNSKKIKHLIIEAYPSSDTKTSKNLPSFYINEANSKFYKTKNIFSISSFVFSIRNIIISVFLKDFDELLFYNRNQVAFASNKGFNKKKLEQRYYDEPLEKKYTYNQKYKELLKKIKKDNPDINIIPIVPPFSAPKIVNDMKSISYRKFYERWVSEVVNVFGKVYDFNRVNSVTACLDNYRDAHHFLPHVGDMIAKRLLEYITGEKQAGVPDDFGVLITKENLEEQLAIIFDEKNLKKPEKIICDY